MVLKGGKVRKQSISVHQMTDVFSASYFLSVDHDTELRHCCIIGFKGHKYFVYIVDAPVQYIKNCLTPK